MLKKVMLVAALVIGSLSYGQNDFSAKLKRTSGKGFDLWTPGSVELNEGVLSITNKLIPDMNVNIKVEMSDDTEDITTYFSGKNYRVRVYKKLDLIIIDSKDEWKDEVTSISYTIKS